MAGRRDAGHRVDESTDAADSTGALRTWSDVERIAERDFAELIARARAGARGPRAADVEPGERRTRRWIPGRGQPHRSAARARPKPPHRRRHLTLPRRRRRVRPRPLVLLCDVSGSMERYSRTLLLFAHTLARAHRRRGVPLRDAADAHHAWRCARRGRRRDGRRLARGQGLVRRHAHRRRAARLPPALAPRALHGGPVVLLISDGWDRGDPPFCATRSRACSAGVIA